jgi:hypothetical protein
MIRAGRPTISIPLCLLDPVLIDGRQAVAQTGDQIDHDVARKGLGQPVGHRHLGPKSGGGQSVERGVAVLGLEKQVEVLGVSPGAGIVKTGQRARDDKGNPRIFQRGNRPVIDLPFFRWQPVVHRLLLPALHRCGLQRRLRHLSGVVLTQSAYR